MTLNPPKKGVAFQFALGLASQADGRVFAAPPTLASGDVKLSKDGGALTNLTSLPTASGALVQIALTSDEMNADRIDVLFHDAAGAEWCDRLVSLFTVSEQFNDLFPASSYVAPNNAAIVAIQAQTDRLPALPAAVGSAMTVADKTGFALASNGLDAIGVAAPTGLATTFPQMLVQLWRRFFKRARRDIDTLVTYADDGTTVLTTQAITDDGVTQQQGAAE
ncbi:MAG: hypothetical protein JSS27_02540 [Planctomycetes bacterium]|nr:hypothetical protein [Planctomycetota bacterium]